MEKLGRNLVLAVALGIGVYAALLFFFNFGDVSRALAGFNLFLIPAVLGLVSLSYVGRFFRWLYYLKILKVSVPLGQNAAIFAAGLSMTISPGKLGEVLKSVFVRQASGAPIARTAPAVVAERATDGTGMVLWGFIGALALGLPPWTMFVFLAVAAFGIAVLRSKKLSLLPEDISASLVNWRARPASTAPMPPGIMLRTPNSELTAKTKTTSRKSTSAPSPTAHR